MIVYMFLSSSNIILRGKRALFTKKKISQERSKIHVHEKRSFACRICHFMTKLHTQECFLTKLSSHPPPPSVNETFFWDLKPEVFTGIMYKALLKLRFIPGAPYCSNAEQFGAFWRFKSKIHWSGLKISALFKEKCEFLTLTKIFL